MNPGFRSHNVKSFRDYIRHYLNRPMVRPLALAGPILVLLIALPLLRPLRHPGQTSNEELLRIATVRALVEHRSLSLGRGYGTVPGVVRTESGIYSAQPPMMAVLLWAPAWVMDRLGVSFENNQLLASYLLTLIGVTLPVAGAAGLIYRMGRLFELRRPWRTTLGIAVVAASGLLSYSVVLNPQAPAATLLLASVGCLIHVAAMTRDDRRTGWFALAGACSALAATIDPAAAILAILLLFVIPTMRFALGRRIGGVLLYVLGAIPVVALHGAWNIPVTGDLLPASVHVAISNRTSLTPVVAAHDELEDDEAPARSGWDALAGHGMWLVNATVGEHGVFSHFPVMILGILGIAAVMHRHWPSSTKTLAGTTAAGAIAIMVLYRVARVDWSGAMFATRWFVVFLPLLLFWAGAWLRRSHTPLVWSLAALLLLFSMVVGLIGATDPTPRHGYDRYTAAGALMRLIEGPVPVDADAIAGREMRRSS